MWKGCLLECSNSDFGFLQPLCVSPNGLKRGSLQRFILNSTPTVFCHFSSSQAWKWFLVLPEGSHGLETTKHKTLTHKQLTITQPICLNCINCNELEIKQTPWKSISIAFVSWKDLPHICQSFHTLPSNAVGKVRAEELHIPILICKNTISCQ